MEVKYRSVIIKMSVFSGESHFLLVTHSIITKTSASSPGSLHPLFLSLYTYTHSHTHIQNEVEPSLKEVRHDTQRERKREREKERARARERGGRRM